MSSRSMTTWSPATPRRWRRSITCSGSPSATSSTKPRRRARRVLPPQRHLLHEQGARVADFLRDQIRLATCAPARQTSIGMMLSGANSGQLMLPGLFRAIVDEADSLLIDEAVTPLIISNSPDDEANATHYRAADDLAQQLDYNRHFTIDRTVRSVDLTVRGQERLEQLSEAQTSGRAAPPRGAGHPGRGGRHCFIRARAIPGDARARFRSSMSPPAASWPTAPGGTGCTRPSR